MTDRKQLYCCTSYYQLMIALMRALAMNQRMDLVLEEHGIKTVGMLAIRLKRELKGCVDQVFVCPDSDQVDPYVQRCASFLPWQRRQVVRHMNQVWGNGGFRQEQYESIHVFWDLGYAGTYFNIRNIHYRLHEDSLNSYQHIRANRPHYSYIFHRKGIQFFLKKYFHMGVIPFGYSHCCDTVEVNDKTGIEIPPDKVEEVPREKLEKQLTKSQREAIFRVFADRSSDFSENEPVLLLTEPFALTGRLPDMETQVRLYRDVIQRYAPEGEILIKAHPRDELDYGKYFPKARIMEKNIPMEILNFDESFRVSRAITVTSSALQGIRCANEKVYLGPEFLHKYKA